LNHNTNSSIEEETMTMKSAYTSTVRRLATEDLAPLEQMYNSYTSLGGTLGLPPPDPVRRKKWLDDLREGINLVAYVDGELVGHLVLLATGDALELVAYVHQDFRRLGVATNLAKAAIAEARTAGYTKIWLLVAKDNIAARQGLEKLGFHIDWEDLHEVQFSYLIGR
jgi:ribosomal protein S18 acetylase RimI-like enzyme